MRKQYLMLVVGVAVFAAAVSGAWAADQQTKTVQGSVSGEVTVRSKTGGTSIRFRPFFQPVCRRLARDTLDLASGDRRTTQGDDHAWSR